MNEFTFIEANLLSSLVSGAGGGAGSALREREARAPGRGTRGCSPSAGRRHPRTPGGPPPAAVGLGTGPLSPAPPRPRGAEQAPPNSPPRVPHAGGTHPSSSSSSSSQQAQERETAGRDNGFNFIGCFFVF